MKIALIEVEAERRLVLHRERIAGRGVRADTLTHGWCRCSTHTTNLTEYSIMQTRRHTDIQTYRHTSDTDTRAGPST